MKLEEVILRDTRAAQPGAATVPIGTLYFVTDESVVERSTGAAWESYSGVGSGVLLADGTVPLTAAWDAGSFKITAEQLESDIVTGTAPLIVASTTLVTNLNADLLDGQEGSYYLDSDNFSGTEWTDLTDGGATALHTHAGSGGDFSNGGEAGGVDRTLGNTDAFALGFLVSNEERFQISSGGLLRGLDPGLAHGMTDVVPTTAFLSVEEYADNAGGTILRALNDSASGANTALFFVGINGAASVSAAPIGFRAGKKSTTTYGPLAASEPAVSFYNYVTQLLTVFGDGKTIIGSGSPSAQFHVDQASTTGAIPVLYLDQADVSEEMIQFETTIGTGNAIEAVGAKSLTPTHFIKVTLPGGLTRYLEAGTIA